MSIRYDLFELDRDHADQLNLSSPPLSVRVARFVEGAYIFLGLYFVSLFSVWKPQFRSPHPSLPACSMYSESLPGRCHPLKC